MKEQELAEVKTRRFEQNLAGLPIGCDWGGKRSTAERGNSESARQNGFGV